ncbi:MAG: hypothetical protein GQ559_09645 [Desulfobulbaceae bacterium]|nr:hypothetical protein [Desulfobulbaceae bacterium]
MKKLFLCLFIVLLFFIIPALAAADVVGRYVGGRGNNVQVRLTVSKPPPAAFIVLQHLPAGVRIEAADPKPSGFDPASSTVKWLFKHPRPGSVAITMRLSRPVSGNMLTGEIRFRHPGSGKMVSRTIR